MLKCKVKISHDLLTSQNCNFSKVRHRLPVDGPDGPKHVGANMRYFNCTF